MYKNDVYNSKNRNAPQTPPPGFSSLRQVVYLYLESLFNLTDLTSLQTPYLNISNQQLWLCYFFYHKEFRLGTNVN